MLFQLHFNVYYNAMNAKKLLSKIEENELIRENEDLKSRYSDIYDLVTMYENVFAELKSIPELQRLVNNTLDRHLARLSS